MTEEVQATIPEQETQETQEETQETAGVETAEETPSSAEETQQLNLVESLQSSGDIPKGVEPFQDENGKLKFVMPINGQKYIVNFNQLLSGFNLNQAGEQKLREGKEMEKRFNALLDDIHSGNPNGKKNLKKFLKQLDYDYGSLGEELLNEVIEESQMSDAEKKLIAREREIAEREAKVKAKEEEEEGKKQLTEIQQKQQEYSAQALNAMKTRNLDDADPEVKGLLMKGLFGKMFEAKQAGYDLSALDALDETLAEYGSLLNNLSKLYSKEQLKRTLPEGFKKLVMELSLNEEIPVGGSIQPGEVEVEHVERKKPKAKKILVSDWKPTL
jgi:hypothetical protein